MIQKDDCYYLGKILKSIGLDGELSLFLDVSHPEEYEKLESVFVEIHQELTPFFMSFFRLDGKQKARCIFEDFESKAAVEELIGKELYLPLNTLPKLKGKAFYYFEVEGFKVVDKNHGLIGTLKEVIDNATNPVLQVLSEHGNEVLIPKNDEFIISVDRENKQLHVDCLAGLIELYLNDE